MQKSSEIGRTVATDFTGALVVAGLLEIDPQTGKRLNYFEVSTKLEQLRQKYEGPQHTMHIIGFAKAVGDIRDGARGVLIFFGIAFVITAALMLFFVKDLKLTLVALVVAMMPVLWLLGTLPILGYGIDPLSILVPFLIFSIGVSHAVQMSKTWEREVVSGTDSLTAAKRAFARLFIPGTFALLTNVLGFAVIMLIPIDIVRELGITASLGVAWMIITNKMLLPILLSHLQISKHSATKDAYQESRVERIWGAASGCVEKGKATTIIVDFRSSSSRSGSTGRTTCAWATTASAFRSCAPSRATTGTTRRSSRSSRWAPTRWAWSPRRRGCRARAPTTSS